MSSEEPDETMQDVGLNSKPGHRKQFVAAIQMLSSQPEHEVPDCNMQDLLQTPLNMWMNVSSFLKNSFQIIVLHEVRGSVMV